jgi:selenocysteine lyase/cysteine desulfurase
MFCGGKSMPGDSDMLTEAEHSQLRGRFPILREKTYLYNCSQGAMSDAAEAGIQAFTESWRHSSAPWNDWVEAYEGMRTEFAAFINADPDEVAIITSASQGINAIAHSLDFNKRPRVVMGEYEFPTMGQIWLAQQARGAQVEFVPFDGESIPYEKTIDERTAIVPLTHVSFLNGFRSDVGAITRMAHDRGALVFLDGYQDCGTRPVDVKALDVDFYVTGTLKYLLGPPGLAFLYVRRSLIERLNPTLTSWMAQRDVFAFDTQKLDPASEARRFEGGSPSIPNIYAARPALQLLQSIGMPNVAEQIAYLTQTFLRGLKELGIATKTPEDSMGPLAVVRCHDAGALVGKLTERGVLVSPRLDGVRFAFHVYNNLLDVETALSALKENLNLLARI